MSLVARNDRLHGSGDGQFHTIHGYQCINHGLEEALKPGFFAGLWSRLRSGDEIRLFEMQGDRVIRMCETIVVSRSERYVFIVPMRPEINFSSHVKQEDAYLKGEVKEEEEVRPEYAKANGTVKWNPGSKKFDVIMNGEVVAKVREKEEAEAIAYGHQPIPAGN